MVYDSQAQSSFFWISYVICFYEARYRALRKIRRWTKSQKEAYVSQKCVAY